MKACIIFLFVFGIQNILWGQEELIVLQNEPIEFKADGFYIKKVTDARKDKENIGFVQKGTFKKRKIDADMKGGVDSAIYNYLEQSFSQDTKAVPIVLHITQLNISESSGLPVKGKAEIKMEFYREKNGNVGKLYDEEAFVEKPAVNVTKTHEERIREVITSCLKSFNDSDWQTITPIYYKEVENKE
jgi:hypothetical protein